MWFSTCESIFLSYSEVSFYNRCIGIHLRRVLYWTDLRSILRYSNPPCPPAQYSHLRPTPVSVACWPEASKMKSFGCPCLRDEFVCFPKFIRVPGSSFKLKNSVLENCFYLQFLETGVRDIWRFIGSLVGARLKPSKIFPVCFCMSDEKIIWFQIDRFQALKFKEAFWLQRVFTGISSCGNVREKPQISLTNSVVLRGMKFQDCSWYARNRWFLNVPGSEVKTLLEEFETNFEKTTVVSGKNQLSIDYVDVPWLACTRHKADYSPNIFTNYIQ